MKILTFSFDDGEIYDCRLAELLRKFGMQATFFLISGQLGIRVPFYRYSEDTVVERVSAAEIPATYCGMEVASHTQFHRLPQEEKEIRREMEESLAVLSRACGYVVCGMAYPGGHCAQAQADTLRRMGLTYARLTEPTHDFAPPDDWLQWRPTCHYADAAMPALLERFAAASGDALFHIYGHSYELTQSDPQKNWLGFERLLQRLSAVPGVQYCTNVDAARLWQMRRGT